MQKDSGSRLKLNGIDNLMKIAEWIQKTFENQSLQVDVTAGDLLIIVKEEV